MQAKIEKDKLQRIFHHVFLSPQLPQEADDTNDSPLLIAMITAMRYCEYGPAVFSGMVLPS